MLDREVRAKFKEFQGRTGKYEDLDIDEVRFEKILLANENYFEFIKGKNKYIQRYIKVNKGEYPILGSSLKNDCIADYIKPIDKSDIVNQKCVSFNKDNAKGSVPFFRDYPFLMDRHHIAIVPNNELVDAHYLTKSLIYFFKTRNFGWGDNVADVASVQKHFVPIPKSLNDEYTSLKIQEAIVEFLENWKVRCTDVHRERASKKKPIYETIKKILVSNTFKGDEKLVENFNSFIKNRKYDLKFSDIEFETRPLHKVSDFPIMTRVSGGTDLTIDEYMSLNNDEKEKYFALVSATVENNQISGYVHKDRLQEKSLSRSNVITWTRINSDFFFLQKKPVCTNDDSFVMDVKSNFSVKFVRFSTIATMKKKKFHWGNKAGKNVVKELEILIPKQLKNYSSKEIQMFLVEFWEVITNEIDYQLDVCDKSIELADKIDQAFLYRTFSKIDWSGE